MAAKNTKSVNAATGASVHASEPVREPKWNDRRKAIVLALRKLGAVNEPSAVTAGEIAAAGAKEGAKELGDKTEYRGTTYGVYLTRVCLDIYRVNELLHNGFASSVRHEGERELRYYLTAKGKSTKFPAPEPKAEKPAPAPKATPAAAKPAPKAAPAPKGKPVVKPAAKPVAKTPAKPAPKGKGEKPSSPEVAPALTA